MPLISHGLVPVKMGKAAVGVFIIYFHSCFLGWFLGFRF